MASEMASALGLLLGRPSSGVADFLSAGGAWERAPMLCRATPERRELAQATPTAERYAELLEELGGLHGTDVQASRFDAAAGERETLAVDEATAETPVKRKRMLHLLRKDGATLQVHQPQRFVDSLWALAAGMEAELGSLCGANAYLTPAGSQGLAPHYDDVEVFVLHAHGRKRWRVYAPLAAEGRELPRECSGDLPREVLGKHELDVTLEPGDMLYLPRGTPHEAMAQGEGDETTSVHVTLSAYQKWTVGDLCTAVCSAAGEQPAGSAAAPALGARRGLPARMALSRAARGSAAPLVAAELRRLANELDKMGADSAALCAGIDLMAADFMASRLPPLPVDTLPSALALPRARPAPNTMPDEGSCVRVESPGCVRVEGIGMGGDSVRVVSCLANEREAHMMPPEDSESDDDSDGDGMDTGKRPGFLSGVREAYERIFAARGAGTRSTRVGSVDVSEDSDDGPDGQGDEEENGAWLPAEYATAVEELLEAGMEGVKVNELKLPRLDERVALARTLWSVGLLVTVDGVGGGRGKRKQKTSHRDQHRDKRARE